MKTLSLAVLALSVAATAAPAQTFGEPTLGGTACLGEANATIRGTVLAPVVVIDGFGTTAETGPLTRATCTLAIPVDVPEGRSVAVTASGYRLDASIPTGTTATVSVEAFLAGQRSPPLTGTLTGPASGAFVSAALVSGGDRQWSACGTDVIVRLNASILVNATSPARATIDMRQLRIALASKPC